MNILVITYALNGLLMVAMPIGLAIILVKRWKPGWKIWWIGAATFILSQAGHIPFNWGAQALLNRTGIIYWSPIAQRIFSAAFLGLSAGLFEETARYLVLRFWVKEARSWRKGILFGAGHGGAEAIILGGLVLFSYVSMMAVHNVDLSSSLTSAQIEIARQQISAYWSIPWYDSLLGALERFFTIPAQIAMAVIVIQAFTRKRISWLFLAIAFHAIIDGTVVFLMPSIGIYWTEVLVGVFAVISVGIIFLLRQPEPPAEPVPMPTSVSVPLIPPVEETADKLDASRFENS
jgi:uncharacterized membrane protein YhfC